MSKKMHDILPPGAKKQLVATKELVKKPRKRKTASVKEVVQEKIQPKPNLQAPVRRLKKARTFPLKEVFIGSGVVVVLLCVFAFFKLPKADVQIWPKTDTLTLSETVVADTSINAVDATLKKIPAKYVEVVKNGQQDFPATGLSSNSGLAEGTVRLYNKITPAQSYGPMKKGTQLLSDSNKLFLTTQAVTVPASKNGTPGFIDVSVQAAQAGADYNIKASKFSLPKLNGTAYYYSIYGASTAVMAGGYTGKVKKVTDSDIQSAKEVLTKQLLDQAKKSLQGQIANDQVLVDGASIQNVVSASASLKPGAVADTFTQTAQVKASALVFKKQDIIDFVKSNINSQLTDDKTFLEDSITITHNVKSFDLQGGKMALQLQASAKTYQTINTDSLVSLFATKSADQIKQVMDKMYAGAIAQLKINFWPFWVAKAPSDRSRIKVNLNF